METPPKGRQDLLLTCHPPRPPQDSCRARREDRAFGRHHAPPDPPNLLEVQSLRPGLHKLNRGRAEKDALSGTSLLR